MDDLAQKLSEILGSPEGMQKLQAAAASMGMLSGGSSEASAPALPGGTSASGNLTAEPSGAGAFSGKEFETMQKLMPLVSGLKKDNPDTMLLKSLRPYLKEDRQQRLDETIKIMHLLKALPVLKDKGGL